MAKKDDKIIFGETIIPQGMEEVMHASMLPYAEYVILERALPRVEDGLKPVQRRILFTMSELSLTPDKPHRKSARIVGDCLGKYHPHGDTSVYDAMVRMAQDFNMRMQLVDGHGNFGSVDGDGAAAMRYTEARMTPLALELLRDLEKDTVPFRLNFDDTRKEPDLLPGRFPNLLVNGASGIAVGLATNIPPHNLGEAIDAVILRMSSPNASIEELMRVLPGPDFPTGGYILDSGEIKAAYETGRSKITMRARTHIEELKNGKKLIVITEFPYQVNKARALEEILRISQEKKQLFAGIADIRDESDRTGTRAVVEVKKDVDAERVLQYLYKYSDLQLTYGVNVVAIADGKPQQLSLPQLLDHYIAHQKKVVIQRTAFDLEAARRREHILEGLMIAVHDLDAVIALIRASKSHKEASAGLMSQFGLSEAQAQAILDLRLRRLTNLELLAIQEEYEDIQKLIKKLEGILASPKKLAALIQHELLEIKEKYADPRRTEIVAQSAEIVVAPEELKVVDEVVLRIFRSGRVRRVLKRASVIEAPNDEEAICTLETATNKRVRIFTNLGNCFTVPVEDFPESRAGGRSVYLSAIIELDKNEEAVSCLPEEESGKLYFFTAQGNVKCTPCADYMTRTRRISAISLRGDDQLLGVEPYREESIFLLTHKGMCIRFATESVPEMGRVSGGVKCMKLDAGDRVVFYAQLADEGEILTLTDRGYAKRSFVFDHEPQGRNGKGVKAFDFKKNSSNGTCIAAAFHVCAPFDFVIQQLHGTKTAAHTEEVPIDNRAGKGTLLVMTLLDDVVTAAWRGAAPNGESEAK